MKKYILLVMIVYSLSLLGQTATQIKLEKQKEYQLKWLKVSEEEFKEPITFENDNSIVYTYSGIFSEFIQLKVIDKASNKTRSITIDISGFSTFRIMAMRVIGNYIYLIGYTNENKKEILKVNYLGRDNKIVARTYVNYLPNNTNLFLLNDSILVVANFYYQDATQLNAKNLNINYFNQNLIKIDSVSINLGVTAFSSIYPQRYFYDLNNRIHFMDPSNGNTYTFNNGAIDGTSKNKQDGIRILPQKYIDTLTHYSIRKDIMSTFWKANDYIYDSSYCYYFFKTPISDSTYLVGINGNQLKKWYILHNNGELLFNTELNTSLNNLNKHYYFSYYFNAINNFGKLSTILVRNEKIVFFKKRFYYTNFILH